MIEPSGNKIDVLGIPNRQTKVPTNVSKAGQHQDGECVPQGQDWNGTAGDDHASISSGRVATQPGAAKAGHDSGSVASGSFPVGKRTGPSTVIGKFPAGGVNDTRKTKQTNPDPDPGTVVPPIFGKDQGVLKEGHGPAIMS